MVNLLTAIDASGLTQAEISRRAEVSATYINQLLKGKNRAPDLGRLEKIAETIGTSVARLLSTKGELEDHPIGECYRRIGELLHEKKEITLEEAADRIRAILTDEDDTFFREVLERAGLPSKKTGD